MKREIFIVVLFFLSFGVLATISVAQQWTVYTIEDGLVGDSIWFIQEDEKGYLWFTTRGNGTSRYDGVHFQNLNTTDGLASDNINFTLADKAGNFWIATDRGVSRYDGKDFQNFDITDGLAGNYVTFILEDGKGNLWFGTDRGVSKYDGKAFYNFDDDDGLADNNVNFILEDRDGNLWFGTEKGVSKYDGREPLSATNLSHPIQVIFEDGNGNLWFGTEEGVYRKNINSSTLERYLVGADISSILEDRSGNLWFATDNQGAIKYDCQNEAFASQDDLADNSILSMLEDSRGNLWFGTDEGISKYDGQDFQNFTEKNGINLNFVNAILEDSDENLWFGTDRGVCKYTMPNLQLFTTENELVDNSIEVILEDRKNNLWFGTRNGVNKYDGKVFQNFTMEDGLVDNDILSIFQDSKGNLWFGTVAGVSKYDGKIFEIFAKDEAPMNTAVRAILEDKAGNLWFATVEGVSRYDGKNFQHIPIENGSEIFMDSSGNLWVGSWNSGIHKYDGKSLERYTMEDDGLASNHITWILETRDFVLDSNRRRGRLLEQKLIQNFTGNIWFGLKGGIPQTESEKTAYGGVCRYDGINFKNFTIDDGLISDSIKFALEDSDGNLWFGTDEGVMKYDSRILDESLRFRTITTAHGLISNYVTSILSDRAGNLWFGTDKGVSKYDSENFQNIPLEEYLTFGSIDAIFEDSQGAMWFITTNDGVIKYTPPAKKIRPRIHLIRIEADRIYHNVDKIRIPNTTKRITFEYKGISFKTKPDKIRYTYQLEGHDKNWHPSNKNRVYYEHLKPGHYQFKVSAIDRDLHYSDPPATVDIDIFRSFYLTPQFIISIVFGGVFLLGGGGYLVTQLKKQRRIAAQLRERLRKQKETEQIQGAKMESLRQLVAGVAHEMNNPIGVISSNNDLFRRTIDRIEEMLAKEYLQKIEENKQLSRILDALDNTYQTSKIASERIAGIVANLRRFVRLDEAEWQMADIHEGLDNTIALMEMEPEFKTVKVTRDYGEIPKIYCSPSSLNQVFRSMLKNASEAIKGEGEIKIRTFVQEEDVKIEISDTGRGIPEEHRDKIFDPGFTTKGVKVGVGLGLSICYQIIDEHNGHIDVASELGKGTTFTITLPQCHDGKEKT